MTTGVVVFLLAVFFTVWMLLFYTMVWRVECESMHRDNELWLVVNGIIKDNAPNADSTDSGLHPPDGC